MFPYENTFFSIKMQTNVVDIEIRVGIIGENIAYEHLSVDVLYYIRECIIFSRETKPILFYYRERRTSRMRE